MEQAELDVALEELESRLERLRALYEQYFMGIEKIEPAIARKDVDRRIYVLRREKIRNTAKRFKLQTIIQRYNTFQQYWQRICREIENGTYKRHLLRAHKNGDLLTIAARKRLGKQGRTSEPTEASPGQPPAPANPVPSARDEAPAPVAAATVAAATARAPGAPPLPPRRPPLPGARPAVPPPASAPVAPAAPAAAAPLAAAPNPVAVPSPKPAPAKFESLDLDMDFMRDWDPDARRGGAKPSPAAVPQPKPAAAAPPRPAPPLPAAIRAAAPPQQPAAAAPPKPAGLAPPPPKPAPAIAPAPPRPPAFAAPPPAAASAVRSGSIPPRPVSIVPRPTSANPPKAPLVPRAPTAPRVPPAADKPTPATASASVDDARLRDLHTRLQQAKQQTKEAKVSFEGLAKSIRATEARLREQHKNRKIEFDVVIKDGKAVVKPIVR